MSNLISISDICKMLHTTSRTLRYYEEIGLISSKRQSEYSPRKYTENEVRNIHKILLLRSLDIPLLEIKELLKQKDLISSLSKRKRQLSNQIENDTLMLHRLELLLKDTEMTTSSISSTLKIDSINDATKDYLIRIAADVTAHFIHNEYEEVLDYFADDRKIYLADGFIQTYWENILKETGTVVELEEIFPYNEKLVEVLIHCTKTNLIIKYYVDNKCLIGIEVNTIED